MATDPVTDSCVIINTDKALVNAIAALVADIVLLLTMLIGLLRHASRGSTGLWKLLYQQVKFQPVPALMIRVLNLLQVYNLDSLGGVCRDSHSGQSGFYHSSSIQLNVSKGLFYS